jgi:hypothetical protein
MLRRSNNREGGAFAVYFNKHLKMNSIEIETLMGIEYSKGRVVLQ